MKKETLTYQECSTGDHAEKIYDYISAVFLSKPPLIKETFEDEFINSLLLRCGLDEVHYYAIELGL